MIPKCTHFGIIFIKYHMRPISKLKSKYPDWLYNYWSFISIIRAPSKLLTKLSASGTNAQFKPVSLHGPRVPSTLMFNLFYIKPLPTEELEDKLAIKFNYIHNKPNKT